MGSSRAATGAKPTDFQRLSAFPVAASIVPSSRTWERSCARHQVLGVARPSPARAPAPDALILSHSLTGSTFPRFPRRARAVPRCQQAACVARLEQRRSD